MVNNLLLLSGIGMMILGVLIPIYYWRTKKVAVKYFAFGAGVWILAISAKVMMDLTITASFNSYFIGFGTLVFVIAYGLYLGLRTGFLESGLTYFAAIKTKLKNMNFKQVTAFGLGFGCFEAAVIGFFSFINILTFVLAPDLITTLPESQQSIVLEQLNQQTWVVGAAIVERLATIAIHVFTTVLVFYAIRSMNKKYLWISIGFKALLDGMIPAITYLYNPTTIWDWYSIEFLILALGFVAYFGYKNMKELWMKNYEKSNNNTG